MRLPDEIDYQSSELHIEQSGLIRIAEQYGTPLYVYSGSAIVKNYRAYQSAFKSIPNTICYAMKANSNPQILRMLAQKSSGADIVSGGELHLALRAGISPEKIVFAGVGKTEAEIREAIRNKILLLNVESEQELRVVNKVAMNLKTRAPVGLRVNPDIDAGTHPYISTGLKKHKFGVSMKDAVEHYQLASTLSGVEVAGIHMHLGSQIPTIRPIVDGVKKVLKFIDALAQQGVKIRILDMGGGLGIRYTRNDKVFTPASLANAIRPLLSKRNLHLVIEPGRSIVGAAGILLTRVLYTKRTMDREFVIVDAGMNDLIRPALYDAYHEIVPVIEKRRKSVIADIVGPVCETGDFFARARKIGQVEPGELVAILNAGAYGYSMSSNYNGRPRPAEVMINGSRTTLIRKRETLNNL